MLYSRFSVTVNHVSGSYMLCPELTRLSGVLQIDGFDWRTLSSFLSPWRYSRTAIELQLALRSLGGGLRDDATREKAEEDLSKFGSSFFGQSLTCEETDLIADMLRGISGVVACKVSG